MVNGLVTGTIGAIEVNNDESRRSIFAEKQLKFRLRVTVLLFHGRRELKRRCSQ